MRRVYLDSNILIAHFSPDGSEDEKRQLVASALQSFSNARKIELYTSMWAVTEMVNILVSNKKMARGAVAEIESRLINERRLDESKLHLLDVSPNADYDFDEFFYHVREGILAYHSGVGDIIHSVIMKNNGVGEILTFDEKEDFKRIPGLTVLHPRDIRIDR